MIRPWKLLSVDLCFSASPWLEIYRETLQLPRGRVIDDFYRIVLPDFASVVAITTDGALVLVRGYKHGLGKVVLSVPGGHVQEGESPLDAARRELLEETGYTADNWADLGRFVVDGNRQCGTMHLFVARDAVRTKRPLADETEELEVDLVSQASAVEAIRHGEIEHLASAGALALTILATGSDAPRI